MLKPNARFESWIGVIALVGICFISLGNVLVRYTTNASFAFTEEFSVVLMVILAFSGAAVAARSNEHIRITLLEEKLPAAWRPVLYCLQWFGSIVVLGIIIWYGSLLTWEEYEWESTSAGLGYPTWMYQIWLPILSCLIVWRSTQNCLERLQSHRSRKENEHDA